LSLAPQRQRHGQVTRSSSVRGSETSKGPAGLTRVGVVRGSDEEGLGELGSERVGIRHSPPAERGPAAEPRVRPCVPVRRDQAPRPGDAEHGERHLGGAGGRADSGRRGEDEAADRVGTQHRGAERDYARPASGRSTPHRPSPPRPLSEDGLGERVDVACFGQRCGASVARQVRDEDAMLAAERTVRERASSRSSRRARARVRRAARPRRPHNEAKFRATRARAPRILPTGFAVRHQ
jgi:hypothetical protein